jgi:hypothetical protein
MLLKNKIEKFVVANIIVNLNPRKLNWEFLSTTFLSSDDFFMDVVGAIPEPV